MRRNLGSVAVVVLALAFAVGQPMPSARAETIQPPPVKADADYQLGGGYVPASNVGIVVRDSTEAPAAGRYNICYLNAFQTQPGAKAFWRARPSLILRRGGKPVIDREWPDEWLLDISKAAKRKRLARIVGGWIRGCAASGYQAVEFDNFNSFSRSRGLIKARHANAFARTLVGIAHRSGLAAGQKNRAAFDGRRLGFDFAIAESCARWNECGPYLAHYGARVIDIEYRKVDFRKACRQIGSKVSVVYADLELSPGGPRDWC
jgi:hypothetical protein